MKYLKRFNESKEDLSIDMIKDILLSVYEDEFDFNKFEFFDFIGTDLNQINFTPNDNCYYFNVSKDKWNTEGSIRIKIISTSFWALDKYDLDKYNLLSELISDWGWRISEPSKHQPSTAAMILHPSREGNRMVYNSFREVQYSIIPN
jgi:hypothetical protein